MSFRASTELFAIHRPGEKAREIVDISLRDGPAILRDAKAAGLKVESKGRFVAGEMRLPMVAVLTSNGSGVITAGLAQNSLKFHQTKTGDSVGYATARTADEQSDAFIAQAGRVNNDQVVVARGLSIQPGVGGGDMLPEISPTLIRLWAHSLYIALTVDGQQVMTNELRRLLDGDKIETAQDGNTSAVLWPLYQRYNPGYTFASPVVLTPDNTFSLVANNPGQISGLANSTIYPFRAWFHGTRYVQVS